MSMRIQEFDLWRPGYAGATVHIKDPADGTDLACFYDQAATIPAANPQALLQYAQDGISYGKFSRPIYVQSSYSLVINSIDQTGVLEIPLLSLQNADASNALAQAAGGIISRTLAALFGEDIHVLNQGVFLPTNNLNVSASTNAATISAAIGASSLRSGTPVLVPYGSYPFTTANIPSNVVLAGQGSGSTMLFSTTGAAVLSVSGDNGGISDITIDGTILAPGSFGILSKGRQASTINKATIKRFLNGVKFQGGKKAYWRELNIESCRDGVLWHGDVNLGGGSDGGECSFNVWDGGNVKNCVGTAVEIKYVDRICFGNTLRNMKFTGNTDTALRLVGARNTVLENIEFDQGGTTAIDIRDGTDPSKVAENTVIGFHMRGGKINGNMSFAGTCQDVVFEGVFFEAGTFTLNNVVNNIVTINCIEGPNVVIAGGDSTKWTRKRTQLADFPNSFGITTDAVATEAWSYNLAPGEKILAHAVVIANGRNTTDYAMYHIARSAQRPGSTLNYDAQTGNFVVGQIITGGSSGAVARIVADADGGATGTLTLRDISGIFIDNELITTVAGGSAVVNGVLAHQNAALLGATTVISPALESDSAFDCDFSVTADEIRVLVTGAAAKTVEWTVSVQITSG